jgi:hypothetical protein
VPVVGDAIELRALWRGGASPDPLANTAVRLRLRMRDCDLYAFRFR